ncbi:MAG TPA: CocE/NonD family hydrolase [Candidatus Dormibacteraeota bacterium]|nr:CocE/NonD family hydrolase [Candidatus Dormibacteraeota bacterium]
MSGRNRDSSDEPFEILFRPGRPPEEGGHPGLRPRRVHEDGMLIEYDTAVPMRDGVRIYVDVFRPPSEEPAPVLVAWSPYGKHGPVGYHLFPNSDVDPAWVSRHAAFEAPDPAYWVRHGYAVINVDPRGTWCSEGEATFWSPQEAEDLYDLVEWAGTRPWSNGRVGMAGVSYLAMVQWRVAAAGPPHLAAINPWEGVTDLYREMTHHGGIPENRFLPMWCERRVPYSRTRVEDLAAMAARHPLFDAYWTSKNPDLPRVRVPAYVVASWSDQGLHTRGTLEGFRRIGSERKWLEVHGGKKWAYFYRPESVERQRLFFDRFLKGRPNEVDSWPRVRIEVRERFSIGHFRDEDEWPLARTQHTPLYLDARTGTLSTTLPEVESEVRYDARAGAGARFDHRFDRDTELTGHMKLALWVEAEGADDLDLFVAVQKLDAHGRLVPFSFFNALEDGPVALGWLRVSHRELDPEVSTLEQPRLRHRRELRLRPGETVPVEIEVWPSSTLFRAGEALRLVVQGCDVYRYPPEVVAMAHTETRNAGHHVIRTGGRYRSHLLVPVVPPAPGDGAGRGERARAMPTPTRKPER